MVSFGQVLVFAVTPALSRLVSVSVFRRLERPGSLVFLSLSQLLVTRSPSEMSLHSPLQPGEVREYRQLAIND